MRSEGRIAGLAVVIAILLTASPAAAYIGPGAGLSAIGTVVALFAAVGLAIVGFVWYPIKRLRRRRTGKEARTGEDSAEKPAA